ncbi:hypothetical protein L798_10976 [Zootermopsis nevadensis]|uniref:Uncharacterized protein n=1 Tax=Zootermopsis nevadensis TaxID=136037 RepID=A0A067R9J4_ZOONE|nr:hypothetical protein L798_10976 [Zootermopsis nevadensis]
MSGAIPPLLLTPSWRGWRERLSFAWPAATSNTPPSLQSSRVPSRVGDSVSGSLNFSHFTSNFCFFISRLEGRFPIGCPITTLPSSLSLALSSLLHLHRRSLFVTVEHRSNSH